MTKFRIFAASCALLLATQPAQATVVEIQTSLGNFQINLYDNLTPETVENFLAYVNNGAYTESIIHRSADSFVIQGGGFSFDSMTGLVSNIPADDPVRNEPDYSNVRGTIAMAKVGGNPDSATNQWFINLGNNAGNLDGQNGGFTVFGEVTGNGMDIVDNIAALPTFAFDAPFNELPLRNYSSTDFNNGTNPDGNNFVIVSAVVVTDTTVDSAAGLNPPTNNANSGGGGNGGGGGGGGGGTIGWLTLLALLLVAPGRRLKKPA